MEFYIYEILSLTITLLTIIYGYYYWALNYWQRRNVPTLPTKLIFGNLENPLKTKKSLPIFMNEFYERFQKMGFTKHGGVYVFASPTYLLMDLELIRNVLTKDFPSFNSHGLYVNENQPISEHLFALEGEKWKSMRAKLSPTFTSGKMKMMYGTVLKCSGPMVDEIKKFLGKPVNIKDFAARYSIDVIGSCAFGIECNSFNDNNTDFINYTRQVVHPTDLRIFQDFFCFAFPNIAKKLNLLPFPAGVNTFFANLVSGVVDYRETKNVERSDFMQLLIQLKNGKGMNEETIKAFGNEFSMDMMTAQAFVFFIAGFETSSSAMTFCLYELARNVEIQNKIRTEIRDVMKKHEGKLTYEGLLEMKYLTQVVEETLRLYPSVPVLNRKCTSTYKVPDCDLVIEEGTNVMIPVMAIQRDARYYKNPSKFDPDRFSDENKKQRNQFTFLPFGEGPRLCIGMRFGLMQAKLGLATLLKTFSFTLNEKTKTPLEFNSTFLLSAKGDVWLNASKIDDVMK